MNSETTKHKRYDEAFNRSAVEHWMLSGQSATQIARELGINVQNLHKWKQKFKALPAGQVAGHGLRSQSNRRFRVPLTDSNHDLPIAPNRLRETPLPTRRCVGWAMSDTLATSLPLAALDMALTHRKPAADWGITLIAACNTPVRRTANASWRRASCRA